MLVGTLCFNLVVFIRCVCVHVPCVLATCRLYGVLVTYALRDEVVCSVSSVYACTWNIYRRMCVKHESKLISESLQPSH